MKVRVLLPVLLVLLAAGITSVNAQDSELLSRARALFKPLPEEMPAPPDNPTTEGKIELGKKLFYDPRLSLSGVISCNSCHNMATYGADDIQTSLGHKFQTGGRNAPTVLNAGLQIAQFWDGRVPSLEEQAKGPVLNPLEMAMPSSEAVVARFKSIPGYEKGFKSAFKGERDPINYDNIARAIAAFERTLLTPSRFDKFLDGDQGALSKKEKQGLALFIKTGCVACHNGANIGGGSFQKFGLVTPYKNQKDKGRFKITHNEADKFVFKVPSLRNVTRTYPYFHDGGVWDIKEAISIMAKSQFGKTLSDDNIEKIAAFLDSLTGEIPPAALTLPVLPPSSPDTPKPSL